MKTTSTRYKVNECILKTSVVNILELKGGTRIRLHSGCDFVDYKDYKGREISFKQISNKLMAS